MSWKSFLYETKIFLCNIKEYNKTNYDIMYFMDKNSHYVCVNDHLWLAVIDFNSVTLKLMLYDIKYSFSYQLSLNRSLCVRLVENSQRRQKI